MKTNYANLKIHFFFPFCSIPAVWGKVCAPQVRLIVTCQVCNRGFKSGWQKCNIKDSGQHYKQLCIFNKQNLSRSDVKCPSCNILSTVTIFMTAQAAANPPQRGKRFLQESRIHLPREKSQLRLNSQAAGGGGGKKNALILCVLGAPQGHKEFSGVTIWEFKMK